MEKQLEISQILVEKVNRYLISVMPEEGCGFLVGQNKCATEFHPVENELHSPVAYRMNPSEQIKVMIEAEERNLEILAIVHSHPNSPPYPSKTDMREARWDDVCYIIVSLRNLIELQTEPCWTGWLLNPDKYEEIPLIVKK